MSVSSPQTSNIVLPIEKLDKCSACGNTGRLQLCASCYNRPYCSSQCQNADWKTHKKQCYKVTRFDLEKIYPFLAAVEGLNRVSQLVPIHPALQYHITNEPNPGFPTALDKIPGTDEEVTVVKLSGPHIPMMEMGNKSWWPKAYSARVRSKLFRRIGWEGYALLHHFTAAFALLAQLYTGTKYQLKYKTSPISDFGLACGKFRVTNADQLAYVLPDGTIKRGQDPNNHWWIYFVSARGEELTLDFCTYTWNLCMVVPTEAYLEEPLHVAPAVFRNRDITRAPGSALLYTERQRFSILRDASLGQCASEFNQEANWPIIFKWVEDRLGRQLTAEEDRFFPNWMLGANIKLQKALSNGEWKRWPETPGMGMDLDPLEEFENTGVMPPPGD